MRSTRDRVSGSTTSLSHLNNRDNRVWRRVAERSAMATKYRILIMWRHWRVRCRVLGSITYRSGGSSNLKWRIRTIIRRKIRLRRKEPERRQLDLIQWVTNQCPQCSKPSGVSKETQNLKLWYSGYIIQISRWSHGTIDKRPTSSGFLVSPGPAQHGLIN